MTVTYTNDPGNNSVDHVRLLVGDTDCTAGVFFLTDEEIQFRIDSETSDERAAWRACQDIVSKLSHNAADWGSGSQSQSKSQLLENYKKLEMSLRSRGAGEFAAIYAGGVSRADKEANEDDTDVVQGTFRVNQFRNDRAGNVTPQTSLKDDFQ